LGRLTWCYPRTLPTREGERIQLARNYPPVTHVLRPRQSSIFLIGLIGGLVLLAITLIPASIPLSASQPGLPIRAGFFYPWFPNAWTQSNIYPYTNFSPALGYYSSSDDAIIDQQLRLAAQAHLDAFVSSWWGPGHHTDSALQHILERSERPGSPNPDLRWAVYYEAESYSDPSAAQIAADLQYLETNVFSHPSFLRVNGLPVVFVFTSATDGTNMAARWAQAKALYPSVYVVLKGHRTIIATPEGHVYINPTGNAGLATGGTGDVLAGMIAAWLGQLLDAEAACRLAVFLHGAAGDLAEGTDGQVTMIATDVVAQLGKALGRLMGAQNGDAES